MGGMAVRDGSLRLAGAVFSINCGAGRNTLADYSGPTAERGHPCRHCRRLLCIRSLPAQGNFTIELSPQRVTLLVPSQKCSWRLARRSKYVRRVGAVVNLRPRRFGARARRRSSRSWQTPGTSVDPSAGRASRCPSVRPWDRLGIPHLIPGMSGRRRSRAALAEFRRCSGRMPPRR